MSDPTRQRDLLGEEPAEPVAAADAAGAPGFAEAMSELEEILQRIEGEETDIDALAAELKRAARLLELCRTKIRRAEVEVSQIVQQLEGAEDEG
ncbi:MAG TPA: exodeoxyribonuclease VII small subunit [Thermoanaerobaculia bacterium]|nr:exodeoxyribonuclease VII small subunit [Thermoanaerobaculia bacterium]